MASKSGHLMSVCACGREKQARSIRCGYCALGSGVERAAGTPSPSTVASDREKQRQQGELTLLKGKYVEALKQIATLETQVEQSRLITEGVDTFTIEPRHGSGTAEGTLVAVASDWHSEEIVKPGMVSGLNEYNPDIAKRRATKFFQSALRLTRLLQQDIVIQHMLLPLLGDFITNEIHGPDNAETNAVQPMHAIQTVQGYLISGIQFLLDHSKLRITLNCHSGNHARTTHKTRFGAENGHSLEYLMYGHLQAYFRSEPRVTFVIPEGMHSYVDVYGQTIRFQHGHAVKYGGGVGGIYIPLNKAIAQWNKAKHADLDVLGHFHQLRDGGNFIVNGSLIGYNPFALSIKADYEPPKQALFLMDKKRGRTCTWPILVDGPATTRLVKAA